MSDMRQMTALGRSIEDGSFAIIDAEAGAHDFDPQQWQVVRRVIHATADFEFKTLMRLKPDAVPAGVAALKRGCPLVCDVKMIIAGLNEERLLAYGCRTHCFISDDDVIAAAKAQNSTRAIEAMRKAHRLGLLDGAIVAVGNAPTALLEVVRLCRDEGARPALVVGVPVGFVSAAESKEAVLDTALPYIVARGRKGGSTIAVAIIHALLLLSTEAASSAIADTAQARNRASAIADTAQAMNRASAIADAAQARNRA
jgi:precorrin-8X/cobalt-precorrin-8 methylmutase